MTTETAQQQQHRPTGFRRPPAGEMEGFTGQTRNVGSTERWVSGAVGAAMVWGGLSRGSLTGLVTAAVGGAVLYRGATGHCPMYEQLGVSTARQPGGARPEQYFQRGIHVEQSFTIFNKTPEELYRHWRDLTNLPGIMRHIERVDVIDDKRSHWVAKAPAGTTVEWDAEIINDEPNETIAWRSLENANVDNAGSVRFLKVPHDRGTEVRVVLDYIPPGGRFGAAVAKLFGREPNQQIKEDLRRFKHKMEAGEVPTIQGQPRGQCV